MTKSIGILWHYCDIKPVIKQISVLTKASQQFYNFTTFIIHQCSLPKEGVEPISIIQHIKSSPDEEWDICLY